VDAASPDGLKGAAIARLNPTLSWELAVTPLPDAAAELRYIDLPDGLRPERLYWGPESRYNPAENGTRALCDLRLFWSLERLQ
jgi:hypothetical protein